MSNRKIFIVVATTGSVPKYINPTESKFISDLQIQQYIPSSKTKEFISTLIAGGWERTEVGGIRTSAAYTTISKKLLESIGDTCCIQKLVVHLTSYGWHVAKDGSLHSSEMQIDGYIPPKLLMLINEFCSTFTEQLIANNWQLMGSGYYLPSNANSPYVPVDPLAIAKDANACFKAGAAMAHIHTRSIDNMQQLLIPEIGFKVTISAQKNYIDEKQYDLIMPEIFKQNPSAIVNLSTSVRGGASDFNDEMRRVHLKKYANCDLAPNVASFSVGPVVFAKGGGYDNLPDYIASQKKHMQSLNIRPELEVFNHTILHNILNEYESDIKACGLPCLFMLVVGVDQSRSFEDDIDDSLIPSSDNKIIAKLLHENNPESKQKALDILVGFLKPMVVSIRAKYQSCKIAVLTSGIIQTVLADLAVELDLDGVRVGMEDTLNTQDNVPGGIRRSLGNLEQVQNIKRQLEKLNYKVLSSEELREEICMQRPEVTLFRMVKDKLAVYSKYVLQPEKLPTLVQIQSLLNSEHIEYKRIEDRFIADVMTHLNEGDDAIAMSKCIYELAYFHGVYIRYLIEEKDRYDDFANMKFDDLYILQNLNFMRQILHERGMSYEVFDKALIAHSQIDILIKIDQFKTSFQRFLEYLTDIPCRYNLDRTSVVNCTLRQDAFYSETMAIYFHYIRQMMLELRARSRSVPKNVGMHSYVVGNKDIKNHNWVMVPSTVTTNYGLGLQLSKGLSDIFYRTIMSVQKPNDQDALSILAFVHAGRELNDEDIIEASMLYNRFANNCDLGNSFTNFSASLIAEHVMLPRIIQHPERLFYADNGLVVRNIEEIPLYTDGTPVIRINASDINKLPMLKLLAHSSGITTAQQWDNVLLGDMQRLGFSLVEQKAIFNRGVILSFASASDVLIDNVGTPVIDLTACNDVRSLAGTTTTDYVCESEQIHSEFIAAVTLAREGVGAKKYPNKKANVIYRTGKKGKKLLRVNDLFLFDDPLRLHDGHSIKRYLTDMPDVVLQWLHAIVYCPNTYGTDALFELLYELVNTSNEEREVQYEL